MPIFMHAWYGPCIWYHSFIKENGAYVCIFQALTAALCTLLVLCMYVLEKLDMQGKANVHMCMNACPVKHIYTRTHSPITHQPLLLLRYKCTCIQYLLLLYVHYSQLHTQPSLNIHIHSSSRGWLPYICRGLGVLVTPPPPGGGQLLTSCCAFICCVYVFSGNFLCAAQHPCLLVLLGLE
jgi:hypothetical protein